MSSLMSPLCFERMSFLPCFTINLTRTVFRVDTTDIVIRDIYQVLKKLHDEKIRNWERKHDKDKDKKKKK